MEIHRTKILGFTLLLAGLVLCGTGLWLLTGSTQYQATARINVERPASDSSPFRESWAGGYDPYSVRTMLEVIQSPVILSNVVKSLDLNADWGKKYGDGSPFRTAATIKLLKGRMNLRAVRYNTLIEISVRSEDPNEAAAVANAIAKASQDFRIEILDQKTREEIQGLMNYLQQVVEQTNKVQWETLEQLKKQLKLPDPEPDDELLKSNYPSYLEAKQTYQYVMGISKQLSARIEFEQEELQNHKTSAAEIFDTAKPPKFPIGPNRWLGVALLVIGLFPTIGGFLLLKSSRHCAGT